MRAKLVDAVSRQCGSVAIGVSIVAAIEFGYVFIARGCFITYRCFCDMYDSASETKSGSTDFICFRFFGWNCSSHDVLGRIRSIGVSVGNAD